jgi:hypothetical protein
MGKFCLLEWKCRYQEQEFKISIDKQKQPPYTPLYPKKYLIKKALLAKLGGAQI